ncbi:sensor domain-containing diguanylate cyclase [Ferribacterium limneticum]|uniref:sensor domain-containing diguanylate cyclase n=1 Tax=Ferribacterium limneticum TaxID=76259 RepID=UPI001CFA013E|nr:diguanylate cyclase [Ferribacterium limneticum]UCV18060.1 diguanylate cyclase [Ferribacterium limneticum]
MTENPMQSAKASRINSAGSMGGLLGLFVIACVEFQRLWPTGTSLIYLLVSLPLLLIWIAHQAGWTVAERNAGLAVDIAIYVLVIASLGIRFGAGQPASELASTLLFWAPLVAAWWAWRYQQLPLRLWLLLGGFFVVLTWPLASDHERLDEHLILSLLIALIVRYAHRSTPPNPDSTMNLRDALTGLPSPECFEAELAHVSAISDRYRLPLSLIACRIGRLETGHLSDDQLCQCAEAVTNRLRTSDTATQWDPSTFMILLPNTPEISANNVANEIRKALEHFNFGQNFRLTVSIATVEHESGEDPMSTVSALENKLANTDE